MTNSAWNPPEKQYAILPMIYGTVIISLIALLIAFPVTVKACSNRKFRSSDQRILGDRLKGFKNL